MGTRLQVVVGLRAAGMNGIETYAEEVAIAAAAHHDVTLLVTNDRVAADVAPRLPDSVKVEIVGLADASRPVAIAGRLWDGLAMGRVKRHLDRAFVGRSVTYDVAHLNRAVLAPSMRAIATRVVVASWFYPHAPLRRLAAAWRHNRMRLPRRAVLAGKSLSYYWGDWKGMARADAVVAPTELLAAQLRSQGLVASWCPPPMHLPSIASAAAPGLTRCATSGPLRLVAVCGDLSHPRKNIADAVRASGALASRGRAVSLELIGRNADRVLASVGAVPANLAIHTPGALSRDGVYERVRSADALVLPSRYEEWGYVAVEALMLGTPVVTYPVYPFPSMLDDALDPGFQGVRGVLGVVADGLRPADLARAIELATHRDALDTAVDARAFRAAAAAARFGPAATVQRLGEVWRSTVESRP